jgi:hypothetical protein
MHLRQWAQAAMQCAPFMEGEQGEDVEQYVSWQGLNGYSLRRHAGATRLSTAQVYLKKVNVIVNVNVRVNVIVKQVKSAGSRSLCASDLLQIFASQQRPLPPDRKAAGGHAQCTGVALE